jgi:hypothetical protein
MAMQEPSSESLRDIIPPTERNEDPARSEASNGLTLGGSRPLTEEERKAADRDPGVAERVYAPASERVAVDPLPGHRDFVSHPDTHTPEREAAGVTRPSETPVYPAYNDDNWNSENRNKSRALPMGVGWAALAIGGGVGGWLFLRWRAERNKPINRIRRQAMQTAGELRERVPSSPEEAVKPAAGLTTALLTLALILWQQSQARSRQFDEAATREAKKTRGRFRKAGRGADKAVGRAADAMSEVDWQKQLSSLKKRWDPSRLDLEKISRR